MTMTTNIFFVTYLMNNSERVAPTGQVVNHSVINNYKQVVPTALKKTLLTGINYMEPIPSQTTLLTPPHHRVSFCHLISAAIAFCAKRHQTIFYPLLFLV